MPSVLYCHTDALAGLVVALVLIYSAFAYADLANCTPAAGIYAALGGMVAFAMFTRLARGA